MPASRAARQPGLLARGCCVADDGEECGDKTSGQRTGARPRPWRLPPFPLALKTSSAAPAAAARTAAVPPAAPSAVDSVSSLPREAADAESEHEADGLCATVEEDGEAEDDGEEDGAGDGAGEAQSGPVQPIPHAHSPVMHAQTPFPLHQTPGRSEAVGHGTAREKLDSKVGPAAVPTTTTISPADVVDGRRSGLVNMLPGEGDEEFWPSEMAGPT
jgi:hypothetical protein